jgi:hypothetical protein
MCSFQKNYQVGVNCPYDMRVTYLFNLFIFLVENVDGRYDFGFFYLFLSKIVTTIYDFTFNRKKNKYISKLYLTMTTNAYERERERERERKRFKRRIISLKKQKRYSINECFKKC